MEDKKICVAGIGGVGGYIGGALARRYKNIYFMARGKRKEHIRQNGIKVESNSIGSFIARPEAVEDDMSKLPKMDIIFVCVKNYSLGEVCRQIRPVVTDDTVIVPIMNGITAGDKIREAFPDCLVLDGLIFVIATAQPDYSIIENSSQCHIHIGYKKTSGKNAQQKIETLINQIATILNQALLTCIIEKDIESAIWQKYILNCAFNTITAYYNTDTDGIRSDDKRLSEYIILMNEAALVAKTWNISIPTMMEKEYLDNLLYKQMGTSSSSLKKDFDNQMINTELDTFSGTLLRVGEQIGLTLPVMKCFHEELLNRVESLKKKSISTAR